MSELSETVALALDAADLAQRRGLSTEFPHVLRERYVTEAVEKHLREQEEKAEAASITELHVSSPAADAVRVDFPKVVKWIIMHKAQGVQFAIAILQQCGVTVTATVSPAHVELADVSEEHPGGKPV